MYVWPAIHLSVLLVVTLRVCTSMSRGKLFQWLKSRWNRHYLSGPVYYITPKQMPQSQSCQTLLTHYYYIILKQNMTSGQDLQFFHLCHPHGLLSPPALYFFLTLFSLLTLKKCRQTLKSKLISHTKTPASHNTDHLHISYNSKNY